MTTGVVGHVLLWLAVVSAVVVVVSPARFSRWAGWAFVGSSVAAAGATAALAWGLVRLDLSLVYVAEAARRSASRPYRLAGLWAGMAGSLLLWMAIVLAVSVVAGRVVVSGAPALLVGYRRVSAGIVAVLGLTVLFAADPFRTLSIPAIDGGGIVPLLEHWAMLIHPPLLYVGLAVTVPIYAVAVAALIQRSPMVQWLPLVTHLARISWSVLVAAMALGAAWSDDTVGWGGLWAWDPVENGVLMPWLALTILLHVGHRRTASRVPPIAAIGPFLLAAIGSALSRSGAALSVHAFAEANLVGRWLSVLLLGALVLAAGSFVVARRPPNAAPSGRNESTRAEPDERGSGEHPADGGSSASPNARAASQRDSDQVGHASDRLTQASVWLLTFALGYVTVGTLAPVVRTWLGGQRSVVPASAFQRLLFPIAMALLLLMVIDAVRRGRCSRRFGARLSHLGMGFVIVGAVASSFGQHRSVTAQAGDTVQVGGSRLTLGQAAVTSAADGRKVVTVPILVDQPAARLFPRIDIDETRARRTSRPDRASGPLLDLQVVIRSVTADGFVELVIHRRSLLWLIWLGATLMTLARPLHLFTTRLRRRTP